MSPVLTHVFNAAGQKTSDTKPALTFAIRTDERHASKFLIDKATAALAAENENQPDARLIRETVHKRYTQWQEKVVGLIATHIDPDKYSLDMSAPEDNDIHATYYSSEELKDAAVKNADALAATVSTAPPVYVSLDDMIDGDDGHWSEIAFSRLFNTAGTRHSGYVGRPTKAPLIEQIENLAEEVRDLKARYGQDVPIVLMEDNVRKAKMLNWVIGLMDKHGVFDNARLAGISTCFSCADDAEKAAIRHDGKEVPVVAVTEFDPNENMDVITPRDLLLDGYVVEAGQDICRLPAVFMDVTERMKIDPAKKDNFLKEVVKENIAFCKTLEADLGRAVPVGWFIGGKAIQHVTGVNPDERMADVMQTLLDKLSPRQAHKPSTGRKPG